MIQIYKCTYNTPMCTFWCSHIYLYSYIHPHNCAHTTGLAVPWPISVTAQIRPHSLPPWKGERGKNSPQNRLFNMPETHSAPKPLLLSNPSPNHLWNIRDTKGTCLTRENSPHGAPDSVNMHRNRVSFTWGQLLGWISGWRAGHQHLDRWQPPSPPPARLGSVRAQTATWHHFSSTTPPQRRCSATACYSPICLGIYS